MTNASPCAAEQAKNLTNLRNVLFKALRDVLTARLENRRKTRRSLAQDPPFLQILSPLFLLPLKMHNARTKTS